MSCSSADAARKRSILSRIGTRMAMVMVGIIVMLAAWAPLLANHRPYISWKTNARGWEMPLFKAMSALDWLWLVGVILFAMVIYEAYKVNQGRIKNVLRGRIIMVCVAVLPAVSVLLRWWGGEHIITKMSQQPAAWWYVLLVSTVTACVLAVISKKCLHARPAVSVIMWCIALLLCTISATIVATAQRPVLDTYATNSGQHVLTPPIPHGWADVHIDNRLQPPGRDDTHNVLHLLGTDEVGADVLGRMVHGARVAVMVGVLSAGLAIGFGALLGLLMGYYGGIMDLLGMRLVELFMAVPRLFLILTVIVFLPTRDATMMMTALILVIGFTGWMRPARLMRAQVLQVRSEQYIQAARAGGISTWSILIRHLLPNTAGPVLVDGGFAVAAAILMETNLSFLGLGVQPPTPSWGAMLSQAIDLSTGEFHWWLAIGPGTAILFTVLACNTLAESTRVRFGGREGG